MQVNDLESLSNGFTNSQHWSGVQGYLVCRHCACILSTCYAVENSRHLNPNGFTNGMMMLILCWECYVCTVVNSGLCLRGLELAGQCNLEFLLCQTDWLDVDGMNPSFPMKECVCLFWMNEW